MFLCRPSLWSGRRHFVCAMPNRRAQACREQHLEFLSQQRQVNSRRAQQTIASELRYVAYALCARIVRRDVVPATLFCACLSKCSSSFCPQSFALLAKSFVPRQKSEY